VNVLNTACSIGTILPLLWHVLSTGHDVPGEDRLHAVLTADAADAADGDTLSVDALWFGRLSRGLFSLMLALSSTAAGIAVSCKIRDIATVEPALRSYAHAKMVKVALAAAVFCLCSLARSYVSLRLLLWEHAPPLTPFVALTYGIVVPELLPTFAALLVLRRRSCSPNCCASPRSCCTGVSSFAGVGEGGGIGMMARALWRCIWHTAMCAHRPLPERGSVAGVHMHTTRSTRHTLSGVLSSSDSGTLFPAGAPAASTAPLPGSTRGHCARRRTGRDRNFASLIAPTTITVMQTLLYALARDRSVLPQTHTTVLRSPCGCAPARAALVR
jgi:hypothetical protein